jgi:hypothetical protein
VELSRSLSPDAIRKRPAKARMAMASCSVVPDYQSVSFLCPLRYNCIRSAPFVVLLGCAAPVLVDVACFGISRADDVSTDNELLIFGVEV